MLHSHLSRSLRIISLLLLTIMPFGMTTNDVVNAANTATTFSQGINAGSLSIAVVDGDGNGVGGPSVGFGATSFSFDAQTTTGTLGIAAQKIRLNNPTATVTWSVTIGATGGDSAVWSDGGTNTYPYNNATADNGRLTVDPSGSTITPWSGCDNTNVSKGSSDYFVTGSTSSIDLMTAATGADPYCRWDLTSISLSQRIPASQPAATYTLAMTITAL